MHRNINILIRPNSSNDQHNVLMAYALGKLTDLQEEGIYKHFHDMRVGKKQLILDDVFKKFLEMYESSSPNKKRYI